MNDSDQLQALQRHVVALRFPLLFLGLIALMLGIWLGLFVFQFAEVLPVTACLLMLSGSMLVGATRGLLARTEPHHLVGVLQAQKVTGWMFGVTVVVSGLWLLANLAQF